MNRLAATSKTTETALKALLSSDERFVTSIGVFSITFGDSTSLVIDYRLLVLSNKMLRMVQIAPEFELVPAGEPYLARQLARGRSADFALFCAQERYGTILSYSDEIKDIKEIDLKEISGVTWRKLASPSSVNRYFRSNCNFEPEYYATVAMTTSGRRLVFSSIDPAFEDFCEELYVRVGRWWYLHWRLGRRWWKRIRWTQATSCDGS